MRQASSAGCRGSVRGEGLIDRRKARPHRYCDVQPVSGERARLLNQQNVDILRAAALNDRRIYVRGVGRNRVVVVGQLHIYWRTDRGYPNGG